MKIVINSCFGGFDLSDACIEELATRKGHRAYKYTYDLHGLHRCREKTYDFYKFLLDIDQEEVDHETAEKHSFESLFEDGDMRTDHDLISLIEEKGSKWASGSHAKLKVIDIPDDVDYIIEEYDGAEWVAEKHRTWS